MITLNIRVYCLTLLVTMGFEENTQRADSLGYICLIYEEPFILTKNQSVLI